MKRIAVAVLGLVLVAGLAGVAPVPAAADAGTTAGDHDRLLEQRAAALAAGDDGSGAFARRLAPPAPAYAFPDCGQSDVTDGDDSAALDIELASLGADCEGLLAAIIQTFDSWGDAQLDAAGVGIDVDDDVTTGCEGYDFDVVVVHDNGMFPGAVFPNDEACSALDPVGGAAGGRDPADQTLLAIVWEEASLGTPSSFSWDVATLAVGATTPDFAPDVGLAPFVVEDAEPSPNEPGPLTPLPGSRPIDPACTFEGGYEDGFTDVPGSNAHESAIDCITYWQLTSGIRAGIYDPAGHVSRGQMASFLARFVLGAGGTLPSDPPNAFTDDDANPHAPNIDKLVAADIVSGRADGTYGATEDVTRAQMATMLTRAMEHVLGSSLSGGREPANYFSDDDGSPHEDRINLAAGLGLTGGTGGTEYSPSASLRRDQMGSFLARGLAELVDRGATTVPEPPPA